MRHVDNAHHAEGDGEADSGEQQHRAERKAIPCVLRHRPHGKAVVDRADGVGRGARHGRRLIRRQSRQHRQRILIAAGADHRDRIDLVGFAGVGLRQHDRRFRLGKGAPVGLAGFLLQGVFDGGKERLVGSFEDGLCSREARGRIGRQQRQAAERRRNHTAQAIVEAHIAGIRRKRGDRRAGDGVQHLVVRGFDENLFAFRIEHQAAVLQRTDDGIGLRVAAGGNNAHGLLRV